MDLHGIVSPVIGAVNPLVPVVIQVSTGYTTNADYKQVPSYADPVTRQGQVQPLSTGDIRHIEGMNLQGVERAIYIHGAVKGLIREEEVGGDLITLPDGSIWLVAVVLEQWPDWCKVGVTRQNP